MQNFIFENPTRIIFGKGQIKRIGAEVRRHGERVLLVYGSGSIKRNGVYDQVTASLDEAAVAVVEFPGARSNPVLSHVRKGIDLARREAVDVVLAVGGGSVIDTAKAIAAGAPAECDVWDFFLRKSAIKRALPVLTVVTVSASASEMNPAAVITNEDGAQKYSIRDMAVQPKASVLDPTVLFSLDKAYSAYSAVDIIAHMLEGYFTNTATGSELPDGLVETLMHCVMESTGTILREPENYEARATLMWSAVLGFNGLTTAGMGIVGFPMHMVEHALSALYDIAHGAGLSIVMPAWMTWAARQNPARFARLARRVFHVEAADDATAAREGIASLKKWFAAIGSPVTLAEGKIPPDDIDRIADNAFALAQIWGLKAYTKEVILEILNLSR
jgi:alcohol dehydrogenase YqhD (iron-dependent ADH family)